MGSGDGDASRGANHGGGGDGQTNHAHGGGGVHDGDDDVCVVQHFVSPTR